MKKTIQILAFATLTFGTPVVNAFEYSISGELAVELTDADSAGDLDVEVTTTDIVLNISEEFDDVSVSGFINYEKGGDDEPALVSDGAGITVEGSFGSIFVGDDGTGVFVGDLTDVLYNNSEAFFSDPTTNVIDYGLPLGDEFSLNIFVDITTGDSEDIDAAGLYGSCALENLTLALGYTSLTEDGAYATGDDDSIIDAAVVYETGPVIAGIGFQDQDSLDDSIYSLFLTWSSGPWAVTPYVEDAGDAGDVTALNVSHNFTDNFYLFFETATYEDDTKDNSEVGLVLTF